ncbi:flagellar FliJ protein [Salirhabdus euzebyi]|uniref:Flagellar FliJ protein n=1 Tax=Salirhabdus euzebyi TaxID=394506 RepID=A0A841Q3G1_9BACI|nr:flagellar export protein FliJ [Salirhabdus euzebyi]MBB6452923.1 flagellar FliJ protein [Salirhabdus euzebyi]
MTDVIAFEKILTVRTTEKDLAYKNYQQAVGNFENVATKLYNLLKEKEDIEITLSKTMESSIPAFQLHHYHQYINQLNDKINGLQQSVAQARMYMNEEQENLTDTYVEMKKIEKLVENKKTKKKQEMDKAEEQILDEVSIQQFIRNRKR